MVVKFRNTICPPQPQLSLYRRAALSSDSNGTCSYIAERTQSAVYIVKCLWLELKARGLTRDETKRSRMRSYEDGEDPQRNSRCHPHSRKE
jgi:hypothetical protein